MLHIILMNNKTDIKQILIGLSMAAVALVLLFALIGDLKVSAIPTMLVLGFLVSLPLIMLNVHGRVLKFMGLAALGFATISVPLLYSFPSVALKSDPSGLTSTACMIVWLILLPILWIEYLKTRKAGKTTDDIEHSYRLIFIVVTIFEIVPSSVALLSTIR